MSTVLASHGGRAVARPCVLQNPALGSVVCLCLSRLGSIAVSRVDSFLLHGGTWSLWVTPRGTGTAAEGEQSFAGGAGWGFL